MIEMIIVYSLSFLISLALALGAFFWIVFFIWLIVRERKKKPVESEKEKKVNS